MGTHRCPEIRNVDTHACYFSPWKVIPHAELMRISETPRELPPQLATPPGIDASNRSWSAYSSGGT